MTLYDTLNYSNFHFIKIRRERERERKVHKHPQPAPTPDARDIFNYKTKLTPRPQLTPFSTSQGKIPITTPTSNQMG